MHHPSGSGSGVIQKKKENNKHGFWSFITSRPFIQIVKGLLFLVLSILVSSVCLVWTDYRRPLSGPLKEDIIHRKVPEINCLAAINILMILGMTVSVVHIFIDSRRLLIIKRFLVIYASCLSLRNIAMSVTSMPDPNPICQKDRPETLDLSFKNLFVTLTGGITCGDMIFSGHFIAYILPAVIHYHFFGNWLSILLLINAAVGLVLIITSRLHYSIDTVLSLLVCSTFNWMYNTIAENEKMFSSMPWLIRAYMKDMEWSDGFHELQDESNLEA